MNAMNAIQRLLTTPRDKWTRQLLDDGFHASLEVGRGILSQESSFELDQAAVNKEKRTVSGTASVEEISRTGLFISMDGLDISQYKKNPVVLASHMAYSWSTMLPGALGTVERVSKKGDTLIFKNMTFDDDPIADAWFQKIVKGIVRMVSIGFIPLQWEYAEAAPKKKGDPPIFYINLTKSELTEISPTPIGANRFAFIDIGQSSATFGEEGDATNQGRLAARIDELEKLINQQAEQIKKLVEPNQQTPKTTSTSPTSQIDAALTQRIEQIVAGALATNN